ncbi:MAG: hypothetical protein R3C49_08220 [Planctomycetaceae bacterium]
MYDECIKLLEPQDGELIQVCVFNEMEGLFELGEESMPVSKKPT